MKIIFIQDSLGTGGAERSNAEFWYYLRDKGVQFKILVLEHRTTGIEKEIINEGFDVIFVDSHFLSSIFFIYKIIRAERPNLVHVVLFKSSIRVRFARIFTKFLLVEHLVNCPYSKVRNKDPHVNRAVLWLYMQIDRFTSRMVDHFIAITNEVRLHYHTYLKIPKDRISVVYRGRRPNDEYHNRYMLREKLRRELGIDSSSIVLINVARQEFQKGHITLLKAIKLLEETQIRRDIVFIFCGRDGNATSEIKSFLKKNVLKSDIKWLGHRYDVNRLLLCADIFVFPSLYEGLGGALIEAQAAGLPIVCSDIKVFDEVVSTKNSLRFVSGNEKDLSNKLRILIEDDSLRKKYSIESYNNFNKNFNLQIINEQLFTNILTIISKYAL